MSEQPVPAAVGSSAELGFVKRLLRWLVERRNSASLRIQMHEELHQLGYTVRDGRLYPPIDCDEWDALVSAMLRRQQALARMRERERLMGGVL